ncbi:hypothetical protein D3C87_1078210 [compost metagenome]
MDLFDLEREVAEQEHVRIAFVHPEKDLVLTNSYRSLHPVALPDGADDSMLVDRVIDVVGHGRPFMLLLENEATVFNTKTAPQKQLN